MATQSLALLNRLTIGSYAITLIFVFAGLFLVPQGQSILSNLLVISGLFGALNYFVGNNKDTGLKDKRILLGFAVYAAMIFINRIIHGDQYGIMRGLFYVMIFVLFIPRKNQLVKYGKYAIVLGGMAIGVLSLWQCRNGIVRVEGFTNAILYSQASLTLALLNWDIYQQKNQQKWFKWVTIFALLFSLLGLYLSQSRGVWLALGGVIGYMLLHKAMAKPMKYFIIALVSVSAITMVYQSNQLVKRLVAASVSDLQGIENGSYDSSWGLRVVAWQSAWLGFVQSPVVGVGTNGFDALKREQVENKQISPLVLDSALAHAHSQYMQSLVIRGGIGFFAFIFMLFWPLTLAGKNIAWTSVGVLLPLSFAINGLSDSPFEHQNVIYLYSLSLLFIWFWHEMRE